MNRDQTVSKPSEFTDRLTFDRVAVAGDAPKLRLWLLSLSDIHLGWENSQAEQLSYFLNIMTPDHLHLNGDIIDGEYLVQQGRDALSDPSHVLALSTIFAKAQDIPTVLCVGNHDIGLEKLLHENLNGLKILPKIHFNDPAGRKILAEHGHQEDIELRQNQQGFWHWFGDHFIQMVQRLDRGNPCQLKKVLGLEADYSFAHDLKHGFGSRFLKDAILSRVRAIDAIKSKLDRLRTFDRVISGHTHTGGFYRTDKGKLYMNSGDSTSYVQGLACDRYGLWGLLTMRLDGLHIQTEHGYEYTETWQDLGVDNPFSKIDHSRKLMGAFAPSVREVVHFSCPEIKPAPV